jgi:hypothetical protein
MVVRLHEGAVTLFAQSTGEPATNFNGAAFSPPDSAYGDYLYVCSHEGGTLDGLFRIAPDATIERVLNGNCIGIAFDEGGVLGRGPVLYVSAGSNGVDLVSAAGVRESLDSAFPTINGSLLIDVPQAGSFVGEMLIASDGRWDTDRDGYLARSPGGDPWQSATMWMTGEIDPYGSAVSTGPPFGDAWLVNTGEEIRAYAHDGSYRSLVTGIGSTGQMALSPDGSTLFVVDPAGDRILRVEAR